ncbi:MAG: hypothetical protein ACR2PL_02780, partial [Dehalococcoidia bacterium]
WSTPQGVSVRRVNSTRGRGRSNIPSIGLFVWRLRPYSISHAPAYCVDRVNHHYTFSILGNSIPLMTRPVADPLLSPLGDELSVPTWIRRRAFVEGPADYYGLGKSLCIWWEDPDHPIPLEAIVPADLSDWRYSPQHDQVAVDPRLGRIVFSARNAPRRGVWVTYHYGFSAEIGGGEYDRPLRSTSSYILDTRKQEVADPNTPPPRQRYYRVGEKGEFKSITEALERWGSHRPAEAIVEILDSGDYVEQIQILLDVGQHLELRAANGKRPVIRLLDWSANLLDALHVGRRPLSSDESSGAAGPEPEEEHQVGPSDAEPAASLVPPVSPPRLVLDGLLIAGRGLQIVDELAEVIVRHCTLVPGWRLQHDSEPENGSEPSLELVDSSAKLVVEHSIIGSIRVNDSETESDPIVVTVSDSILDATAPELEALSAPDGRHAHAVLTVVRSTVIGSIVTHAIDLAENSIFAGSVRVARRQQGCMRFCSLAPDSRAPRRYNCQPDLVLTAAQAQDPAGETGLAARESLRVRPQFSSVRYGTPTYCRPAASCAPEIRRGADDEAAMGAFHDLFEAQRETNLQTRLDEYTPAGTDAGIVFVT